MKRVQEYLKGLSGYYGQNSRNSPRAIQGNNISARSRIQGWSLGNDVSAAQVEWASKEPPLDQRTPRSQVKVVEAATLEFRLKLEAQRRSEERRLIEMEEIGGGKSGMASPVAEGRRGAAAVVASGVPTHTKVHDRALVPPQEVALSIDKDNPKDAQGILGKESKDNSKDAQSILRKKPKDNVKDSQRILRKGCKEIQKAPKPCGGSQGEAFLIL
ncbi:uncharacterized protein LOC127011681 [Drosophila biarmipes]|uniref:uncharacterized protein LOC127011681 n=1 Tax=Drosophila biarmipes TaxID=125945 RepID=UPI0021CCE0DF|nr:uncharacterized protein LOC127011681 [Drosophila biarmipes]